MSVVPGIVLGGAAVPTDSADTYPVTDPQWGLGGLRTVATTADRNATPVPRLQRGMFVHCTATGITYRLKDTWPGGVLSVDADWEVAVGVGGGVTGAGAAECVTIWQNPTTLSANVFFKRYNSTSIVANSVGFTSMTLGTVIERYIDPAGNNSNTGTSSGPANAWLTTAYAISQCQQMGPGKYRINVAAGSYNNSTIDIHPSINATAESSGTETVIEILGDEVTPSNCILKNTSTNILYHSAPGVSVRFAGIKFAGGGSNSAILQTAGTIYLKNVEAQDYGVFLNSTGPTNLVIEAPVVLTDTSVGFRTYGWNQIYVNSNVTLAPPNPLAQDPVLFNTFNTYLSFGTGITAWQQARPGLHIITSNGYLIDGVSTVVSCLNFLTLRADECMGLWRLDKKSVLTTSTPNTFWVTSAQNYFELYNGSIFNDASGNTWLADSLAPGGVQLGTASHFSSDVILATGTPPITFLQDYMVTYVQYAADPNFTRYALDTRYTEKYGFTTLGEQAQGITTNCLTPAGYSSDAYYFYIAQSDAVVTSMTVENRIAPGVLLADTYYLYVNGVASSLSVSLTTGTSAISTGSVSLVAGDVLDFRVSTSAFSLAQDITIQITLKVLGA